MKDNLLCKAKDINTGAWLLGYPLVRTDMPPGASNYFISRQEHCRNEQLGSIVTHYPVDPSTLCRCTGLVDKNGLLIFEHDYVATEFGRTCKVIWFSSPAHCGWDLEPIDFDAPPPSQYSIWSSQYLEVCGNEFDGLLESA